MKENDSLPPQKKTGASSAVTPADIRKSIDDLTTSVSELSIVQGDQIHAQEVQIKKTRRFAVVAITGLLLDMVLTVLGIFIIVKVDHNSKRIDRIQTKTSTEAFCPLYDIFLDSYAPDSPQAKLDPKAYSDAFTIIERGATVLDCSHHTRGKN